jgi:hypothetical protein
MALLTAQDVRDVQSSFAVMDDSKTGLIDMDRFYTLWLGLGFSSKISKQELVVFIPQTQHEAISLDVVLTICSRVSFTYSDMMLCIKSYIISNVGLIPFFFSIPEIQSQKLRHIFG